MSRQTDALDEPTPKPSWLAPGAIAIVRWYRDAVSPALPPRCRFYPTCSSYAVTALTRYGVGRGSWLALRRIVRCGPWHPGGVDHVPSRGGTADERDQCGHVENAATPAKGVGPQRRSVSQETAVV